MKGNIFSFLFILISLSAFAQKHIKRGLIGKWEGADRENEAGSLIFKDNSKVDLKLGARLLHDLDYKVDLTKTPAPLDITIKTLDGKQRMTLKCLIQFIDNNTLKWQIFPDGNRPATFNENSNDPIITLKRGR